MFKLIALLVLVLVVATESNAGEGGSYDHRQLTIEVESLECQLIQKYDNVPGEWVGIARISQKAHAQLHTTLKMDWGTSEKMLETLPFTYYLRVPIRDSTAAKYGKTLPIPGDQASCRRQLDLLRQEWVDGKRVMVDLRNLGDNFYFSVHHGNRNDNEDKTYRYTATFYYLFR